MNLDPKADRNMPSQSLQRIKRWTHEICIGYKQQLGLWSVCLNVDYEITLIDWERGGGESSTNMASRTFRGIKGIHTRLEQDEAWPVGARPLWKYHNLDFPPQKKQMHRFHIENSQVGFECVTWGHSPPERALLLISSTVRFLDSWSERNTKTGLMYLIKAGETKINK